jgi:hypothetical protein
VPDIISRKDALALGLTRYFTGTPCKHGHVSERYTENSTCVQCNLARMARRYAEKPEFYAKKHKDYIKANPEKRQKYQADYLAANREKISAYQKEYGRARRAKAKAAATTDLP